ncbi:MAG: YitT family protein [Eubacterium sp.]
MKKFQNEAYGYIKDMFVQHNMVKRCVLSVLGIIVMGFGISLFSVSGFGVDPFTSMNMNISSAIGVDYGTLQMLVNTVILLVVIIFAHRGLVGISTVVNMAGLGYAIQLFKEIIEPLFAGYYDMLIFRVLLLLAGIIILCFGSSMLFTTNVGVGPYDAICYMFSQMIKVPYKWMRIFTDVIVIAVGLTVSGGLAGLLHGDLSAIKNIGIGTLITALLMGPLVNFFAKKVSSKIMDIDFAEISKDMAFFMIKGAMLKNAPINVNHRKINMESTPYQVFERS